MIRDLDIDVNQSTCHACFILVTDDKAYSE